MVTWRCRRRGMLWRVWHRGNMNEASQACAPEHGNPVNPMVGKEMQQAPDAFGGANRRGGEKPRGRHTFDAWQRGTKTGFGLWEDALKVSTTEGWIRPGLGARSVATPTGRHEMRSRLQKARDAAGACGLRFNGARLRGMAPSSPIRMGVRRWSPGKANHLESCRRSGHGFIMNQPTHRATKAREHAHTLVSAHRVRSRRDRTVPAVLVDVRPWTRFGLP